MTRESLIRLVCNKLNKFPADLIAFWRQLFGCKVYEAKLEMFAPFTGPALIYAALVPRNFILSKKKFAEETRGS